MSRTKDLRGHLVHTVIFLVFFSEMRQSNNKIPVKITDQFQDIDPWHLEIQI